MIITRAPLRIPLGGGGTDFPSYYLKHGGYILGAAINKYVHVVLHDTIDPKIRLKYSKTEVVSDVDELENRVAAEALKWYNVTKGVEIATFSDVPESSGLGGSSAFCVALVIALRRKLGLSLDEKDVTFASAYDIERNKAVQPGGMQDQFFATFGGAWSLDLLSKGFNRDRVDISNLIPHLKLIYTNSCRMNLEIARRQTLETSGNSERMVQNLDSVKALGKEVEQAICDGKPTEVGRLFREHWLLKKQRDNLISNPYLDELYDNLMSRGAVGGKLIGLGGGGYFLLVAPLFDSFGLDCIDFNVDTEGAKVVYEA